MPTISSFHGILIRMVFFDAEQQHLAHIHARNQGQRARFAIESRELQSAALPRAQTRRFQARIEIQQDDLAAAWQMPSTAFATSISPRCSDEGTRA